MNKERIMRIIKDIERFSKDLSDARVKSIEELKEKEKFYAASMMLFSITNRAIDLGEEVVSDRKLGVPETYRDIFYFLERDGIIDSGLRKEFSSLIHFRNLAAHEYQNFAEKDVFAALKNISSVNKFVEIVKKLYSK